jgi:hypothetical protein
MTTGHSQDDQAAKQAVQHNIDQFGCHLALLEPDNYLPGFVYSIGLYQKFGHPELICFGLKNDIAASLLNHACDLIKKGGSFIPGKLYPGFLQDYSVRFLQMDLAHYPDYVGYAGWFYGMTFNFPVLQLVWPDKQHRFPWENDFYEDWKFRQPLLDRNTDFKFYEERNLGVFTTRSVLDGTPILYAYHNDDGDWQFHATDTPDINDSVIVCLEKITKMDPSVNQLFSLQFGWRAWRDSIEDEWQTQEDPNDEV